MTRKMKIWNRDFDINIVFDVYDGEEVLQEQKSALEAFGNAEDELLSDTSEVEKYCIKNNQKEIGDTVSNIFKYVIPTTLLICRKAGTHKVALLCNYRFDEEHGIALVFENEKLERICSQEGI